MKLVTAALTCGAHIAFIAGIVVVNIDTLHAQLDTSGYTAVLEPIEDDQQALYPIAPDQTLMPDLPPEAPLIAPTVAPPVTYSDGEVFCLEQAVYFEARGESTLGQAAVAHNILNRQADSSFPNTICGVIQQGPRDGSPITINRCQYSWYCDGKSDAVPTESTAWKKVQSTVRDVLSGVIPDPTNGANHYHATYVHPGWANVYTVVARVDNHIFYRD